MSVLGDPRVCVYFSGPWSVCVSVLGGPGVCQYAVQEAKFSVKLVKP